MSNPFPALDQCAADIALLEAELQTGLNHFWDKAAEILAGGPIQLIPPNAAVLSLPRNFFSTLFLYSYYRVGLPRERRILYAALNQCLRGMVTGCDNLLDDEYKVTLDTDLPPQAHRFRSVLDIMVADRVLFALLCDHCRSQALPQDLALSASRASLAALTASGAQEASEEGGITERLAPDAVLANVHHFKTGVLFQSVWAIPALLEPSLPPEAKVVRDALYRIGIGCQLLDDIVDLAIDLRGQRHNYAASLIAHSEPPEVWARLQSLLESGAGPEVFYKEFQLLAARLKSGARQWLEGGLSDLFLPRHQGLVQPAAAFIAGRIGVQLG